MHVQYDLGVFCSMGDANKTFKKNPETILKYNFISYIFFKALV